MKKEILGVGRHGQLSSDVTLKSMYSGLPATAGANTVSLISPGGLVPYECRGAPIRYLFYSVACSCCDQSELMAYQPGYKWIQKKRKKKKKEKQLNAHSRLPAKTRSKTLLYGFLNSRFVPNATSAVFSLIPPTRCCFHFRIQTQQSP